MKAISQTQTATHLCCAGLPLRYASRSHLLYLLAEDDLPTYRGWTSSCTAPQFNTSTPAGPCDAVTVVACSNTQTGPEVNNPQLLPYASWDATAAGLAAPTLPKRQPLRIPLTVPDNEAVTFPVAALASTGNGSSRALVFSFAVSRPALVRYTLVRNIVEVLAWGMYPVFDAGVTHQVTISRACNDTSVLAASTAYGVWYNATDIYGGASPLRMISAPLT